MFNFSNLLPLAFAVPLFACVTLGIVAVVKPGAKNFLRISRLYSFIYLLLGSVVFFAVDRHGILVYNFAGWRFPAAINYVADNLSAVMLLLAGVSSFLVNLLNPFSDLQSRKVGIWILFHGMQAGIHGAFLTGDLFNLFVAFEVFLILSYGLVMGLCQDIRSIKLYLFLNVTASTLLLFGVAFLYGVSGSLNMAEIGMRVQSGYQSIGLTISFGFFVIVALLKSGAFPFFQWMPDTYSKIPAGLSCFFASLLTKVGIYLLLRVGLTVMPTEAIQFAPLLKWIGLLSVFVGVLAALGQMHMKRLLAFHTVSQIGYILVAISLAFAWPDGAIRTWAIAAAILFVLHHSLVKSSLFAISGVMDEASGTSFLGRSTGYMTALPWAAYLFLFSSMALAGLPPSSGFYGKLYVLKGLALNKDYLFLSLLVFGSLLTLASMLKIWVKSMTGEVKNIDVTLMSVKRQKWPLILLVGSSWFLAFNFPFLKHWLMRTSDQLSQPSLYYDAVKNANATREREP